MVSNPRSLSLLALFALALPCAAAALLAAGALAAAARDAEATRRVRQAVNAARKRLGAASLAGHELLQQRADRGARAMALAILANPAKPLTPAAAKSDSLLGGLAGSAKRAYQLSGTGSVEELAAKAADWKLVGHKELTHLGLSAWRVTLDSGQRAQAPSP